MANWIGAFRSNYFRVKDAKALEELLNKVQVEDQMQHWTKEENGVELHAIGAYDGIPTFMQDPETGDEIEGKEFLLELGQLLVDDEVAIFMEGGNEKLRYCSGCAIAVSRDDTGETQLLSVNLEDIYGLVKSQWGITPTQASY